MRFIDWDEISYATSTERQLQLVEEVAEGLVDDTVIFCTHPPVVTLGRSTEDSDYKGWSGEVAESSRGGRATYHGPEQLVIYPILDLRKQRPNLRTRDVHHYLRQLEMSLVSALGMLGVRGATPSPEQLQESDKNLQLTGVWVENKKVASIGIAVRKWVTYHGVAINLYSSPQAFYGIKPCGFTVETMTSLLDLIEPVPPREQIIEALKLSFLRTFGP